MLIRCRSVNVKGLPSARAAKQHQRQNGGVALWVSKQPLFRLSYWLDS